MADLFGYEPITSFRDEYDFLSNFFIRDMVYENVTFRTTEHAFQWAKTLDPVEKQTILDCYKPGKAKREGHLVTMRPDWKQVRIPVMFDIRLAQFTQHPDLLERLLATEEAVLIEGNNWHDNDWGSCICETCGNMGSNDLGIVLMNLRDHLRRLAA